MFDNFPDSSRVWIFASKEKIANEEALTTNFKAFISEWLSHKNEVRGDFSILYSRFIIFVADNDLTHVSGCSIDSLFKRVREVVELASPLEIFYRDGEEIRVASVKEIREMDGEIIVFQNSVQTLGELRGGKWECKLGESRFAN